MSEKEKQKDESDVERKNIHYSLLNFTENMLETENFDDVFRSYPVTEDTKCGFGPFQGSWLQIFANMKCFVFFNGLAGLVFGATYSYFSGTISTLEKRFKIPSRNSGIISTGCDVSSLFISAALTYYAGKGHRPRWIALGLSTTVLFCLFNVLPQLLYGIGSEAEMLTKEFGSGQNITAVEILKKEALCHIDEKDGVVTCDEEEGNFTPQIILFFGQMIAGIGQSLYYTLGAAYIDDNAKKSKSPTLISLLYFLRLIGPALGYSLASFCLKIYIAPNLTPTIDNTDPRWLGAWWMGWMILGSLLIVFTIVMSMFPKELPRAALRKQTASERRRRGMKRVDPDEKDNAQDEIPASLKDMMVTFKRLTSNTIYMCNNFASVFYLFGFMVYWIFTPKYIEVQYKQSASVSSLVTGTVTLVFCAIGVVVSTIAISKFKPSARTLSLWNVFIGFLTVAGIVGYTYLGCDANKDSIKLNFLANGTDSCNSNCHCDYVKYSPVCGSDNFTYISACHAGCKIIRKDNGSEIFENCSCIQMLASESSSLELNSSLKFGGSAIGGSCPVDCERQFIHFVAIMCFIQLTRATGWVSEFLVSVRCVEERDKTVSMGFSFMILCLFAFIPSPIFFGYLFDQFCIVWGKTCSGKGNCWLYDAESLRLWMNYIAAAFVFLGTLFDVGVWTYSKNVKIFDDETKETEMTAMEKKEKIIHEKTMTS